MGDAACSLYSESPYLMQDVVATSYGQSYSAEVEFSFSPFKFMGLSYEGNVLYTLYGQEEGEGLQPLLSNSNHLGLRFRLPKNIHIDLGGDHYYNGASAGKKNFVLFDAGIEYSYNTRSSAGALAAVTFWACRIMFIPRFPRSAVSRPVTGSGPGCFS